jgi:hypothetical protein
MLLTNARDARRRWRGSASVTASRSVFFSLIDGAKSPLFNPRCGRTVIEAVWEVADALGVDEPPASGFDVVVS